MENSRNIVVGFDFSECSKSALMQALRLSRSGQAQLHVLHVIQDLVVTDLAQSLGLNPEEIAKNALSDSRGDIEKLLPSLGATATPEIDVRIGSALQAILDKVEETAADLLVLGVFGTSGPRKGAGTFATKCVRKVDTRILLVDEEQRSPFESVVACIDFSETSRRALAEAIRVARQDGARLRAVHVYYGPWHKLRYRAPVPEASPAFKRQYLDRLDGLLEEFVKPFSAELADLDFEYELYEDPSYGIGLIDYAEQQSADLVVLGTANGSNLRYFLVGSTAERVLRELACSVLMIRPEATT